MNFELRILTVEELLNSKAVFNMKPYYQRGPAWNNKAKQRLIESILEMKPCLSLVFHTRGSGILDVVDGQQRLTSILDFVNGDFALPANYNDIGGFYYTDLHPEDKHAFHKYPVSITVVKGQKHEVADLFGRLQCGKALNDQERRKPLDVPVRYRVYDDLVNNQLFELLVKLKSKGDKYEKLSSKFLCLMMAGRFTTIQANQLNKLYHTKHEHKALDRAVCKTHHIMSLMAESFPEAIKNVTDGEIVALFCFTAMFNSNYNVNILRKSGDAWLKQFKLDRKVSCGCHWEEYNKAVKTSDSDESIKVRATVMLNQFISTQSRITATSKKHIDVSAANLW